MLKRGCKQPRFDRRQLKKVKGIPRDQLHALVDKVEISANFEKDHKSNVCLLKCSLAFFLVIVVFCVMAASKSEDNKLVQTSNRQETETKIGEIYFSNASTSLMNQTLREREEAERKELEQAIMDYNKTSVEDDEKTAQILLRTYNSIIRKRSLPKLLLLLVTWLMFCPLFIINKYRRDTQLAFQNVTSLLNIENELYFCKKGFVWSVDHTVCMLRLVRTHDPKSFEAVMLERREQVIAESTPRVIAVDQSTDFLQCEDSLPLHRKSSEISTLTAEQHHIYHGSQQPGYAMNPVYQPYGYYPMGYPAQGGFQQPLQFYHHPMQMMQGMNFNQGQMLHPNSQPVQFGPDTGQGPGHQQYEGEQQENLQQKDNTETGDESDDDEDDADPESSSENTQSKHRSFGKKRKINPDSGSVGAKFLTSRMAK